MSLLTNLVAAYGFDETSGNIIDLHADPASLDLVPVGTLTYSASGVQGTSIQRGSGFNARIAFGGAHEAPQFNDGAGSNFRSGDFSIEIWVYLTAEVNFAAFIHNLTGSNDGYRLAINTWSGGVATVKWLEGYGTSNGSVVSTDTLVLNTWYQITVVHTHGSSGGTDLYINNGTPVSVAGTASNISANTAGGLAVFGSYAGGNPLTGGLDLFRRWDRVLTSVERTWLYNDGAGRTYADFTPPTLAGQNSYNLTNIARRIKSEDCHMLIVGDSQNETTVWRGPSGIIRTWKPNKWVGAFGPSRQFSDVNAIGVKDDLLNGVTHNTSTAGFSYRPDDLDATARAATTGFDMAFAPSLGVTSVYTLPELGDNTDIFEFSLQHVLPGAGNINLATYHGPSGEVEPFNGESIATGAILWARENGSSDWLDDTLGAASDHFAILSTTGNVAANITSAAATGVGAVVNATANPDPPTSNFDPMSYTGKGDGGSRMTTSGASNTMATLNRHIAVLSFWWMIVDTSDVRVPGFSMDYHATSGWSAMKHLSFMTTTAAGSATQAEHNTAVRDYLSVNKPNTFFIFIGHNGESGHWGGSSTGGYTMLRSNLDNLITQRAADAASYGVSDPHFLIIVPWSGEGMTVPAGAMDITRRNIMFEIAQTRQDYEVGVVSLYDIYGGADFPGLPGSIATSNIHPKNQTDANDWTQKVWNELMGGVGKLVPIMAASRR